MAPIKAPGSDDEPIYRYLRSQEQLSGELEAARLLYVATTRAKRHLHLIANAELDTQGAVRRPGGNSLLASLWPAFAGTFEQCPPPTDDIAPSLPEQAAAPLPLRRLAHPPGPPDWPQPGIDSSAILQRGTEALVAFDWASLTARLVGTLTHRYLALIAEDGVAAWPRSRLLRQRAGIGLGLRRLGVAPEALERATELVLTALNNTLEDPRGRWLLGHHQDARSELALGMAADGEPKTLVIDRTFVDDGGMRWIIDYKTGQHLGTDQALFLDREVERYRSQLEAYAGAFAAMENRPTRLALYFPLLRGWREWPA
jgi:hypothetical protein